MLTFQWDILGDESEMSISYGTTQPVAHVGSQGGFLFWFFYIEISQMVSLFDLILGPSSESHGSDGSISIFSPLLPCHSISNHPSAPPHSTPMSYPAAQKLNGSCWRFLGMVVKRNFLFQEAMAIF